MLAVGEEHFVGKIAQKAIIEHEGKILITRDSRDDVTWELPGGRLNVGEEPALGLARELKEELGIDFLIKEILYAQQFIHTISKTNTVVLIYRAEMTSGPNSFQVDPIEIAEIVWIDATTMTEYRLFPEYERALSAYFASL